MFLKKGPWRTEASTAWGVGMFLSLARATVLATGPALKQEERKSFKTEAREAWNPCPAPCPLGLWHWPRTKMFSPEGWEATLLPGGHPPMGPVGPLGVEIE